MCTLEGTEETEKIHNEGTKRTETNEVFTTMAIRHPVFSSSRAALCAVWAVTGRQNKHRALKGVLVFVDLSPPTTPAEGRRATASPDSFVRLRVFVPPC